MKQLTAALVLIFALSGKIFSQCNPAIPANAFVVNATQTTGFGGSHIWVCSNDTLTSNGGSNTIYLEVGAYLMAGGGSNFIYCPPGATVNVSSGLNTIYYVNPSDLVNTGGGPILNPCTSIAYDYSNAPTPGCNFTTAVSNENFSGSAVSENIFPNPANDFTQFNYFLSSSVNTTLKMFNYFGAEIVFINYGMQSAGQHSLKLETYFLPVGIYDVRIEKGSDVVNRKLVIAR